MFESKEEARRQLQELHNKLQVTHQELQENFDKVKIRIMDTVFYICLSTTNISIPTWSLQQLKEVMESKEENLRQCKDNHNKEMAELNDANQELQQRFDKVI